MTVKTLKTLAPPWLLLLRLCAVFTGLFSLCGGASAKAQVIEIGSQGAVTVYDGPAVVTSNGVTSIRRVARTAPPTGVGNGPPPQRLSGAIADAARASDLSASLIAAIAWRESNFRASAVSRAGALGEMQLLPATARKLGVDPRVSSQNVAGGAAYVRALLQRYHGDLIRTLAAYNAGPEAVDRYGGVPPFKETQAYVAAVLDRLSQESVGLESVGQERVEQVDLDPNAAHQSRRNPRKIATSGGLESPSGLLVVSESGR